MIRLFFVRNAFGGCKSLIIVTELLDVEIEMGSSLADVLGVPINMGIQ